MLLTVFVCQCECDWKEIFDVGKDDLQEDSRCPTEYEIYGMGGTCNQWPECQTNFHDAVMTYFDAVTVVSQALLDSLGCSFGEAGKKFIRESFKNHTSFLRLNFYPKCPSHSSKLGVNRHTDAGGLTIILMDEDVVSLQINRVSERGEDNWVDVSIFLSATATLYIFFKNLAFFFAHVSCNYYFNPLAVRCGSST